MVASAIEQADPGNAEESADSEAAIEDNTIRFKSITASLPEGKPLATSTSGVHVYEATKGNIGVRGAADGFQVAKVMQSSQEATPLSIDFPGQHLEALPNGSVLIRQGDETGEPIGTIDPAWAKDANGADVATSFTVNGSTLTQSISPDESTTYPLVADPRVRQAWYGWSIDFSKSETAQMAKGTDYCVAVSAVAPVPSAVRKVLQAACGTLWLWAHSATDSGKCISVKITWAALAPPWPIPPLLRGDLIPWISPCYS